MSRVPSKTTVAVLLGGWSAEREVSLSSGKACTAALERAGFKAVPIDAQRETIVSELQRVKPDVAFNALHGKWGEDGCCAAILETLQIPYTHSGVLASSLAMHKEKSKALFRAAGIPVAESMLVPLEEVAKSHPMKPPYVVKPVAEGSSVGVHIVCEGANTPVTAVLSERAVFGSHAMVERFIPGRELTCAVVGDTALGVIDIVSRGSGWYDYEAKYAPGGSQHILPAQIPTDVYKACRHYALAAHDALGCRGVSRTDFRYDDSAGELIVLEVNTQPGMTGTSLVPELAAHAGQSYEALVTWMVDDASVDR
ncbi:MAG: D-alanine--D-alanine ligase [Aestuariivirga sp.]|uniref:D-alanine--D-alanine ligase n=1 Tax=Aestuariivirga sp. TaxID=2650926 RepID=UPI0025BB457D|nr:D-alanine--D-alanine ligase [Aestuariivirga sp.]MCA3560417.1 D-alanine--D-alanine ligase [Aestuariivirga sp.]